MVWDLKKMLMVQVEMTVVFQNTRKQNQLKKNKDILFDMDKQIHQLEEVTDSESETEKDECRLESKAKKVWKNPKVKQEVLRMLNRFDDKNANIQEKPLKGFKSLTELKNSGPGPRILVYRGKNEPPTVIGFCMRNDLDATLAKLKGK